MSGKSKKWRSIFNLGRSVDSKGKLNRNGSVFIRSPGITGTCPLRKTDSTLQVGGTSCLETVLLINTLHTMIDQFSKLLSPEKAPLRPSRSMESLCSLPTGANTYMHEFHAINFSLLSNCVAVIVPGELMMSLIWPR